MCLFTIIGNWIGVEGAKALSEMLKVNASIKVLDMKCDDE